MSETRVILDASALIALLLEERGCEVVTKVIAKSIMSAVNIAEVAKILLTKKSMSEPNIINTIEGLVEEIIPFDLNDAYMNASLVPTTALFGLSLGDRACIALGIKTGYPVYTADKEWSKLDCGCQVIQIR